MSKSDTEIEVKFYLSRRIELEERLIARGGKLKEPRIHEVNFRFDTPDQSLLNTGRLLRLRQDSRTRLTYKGPGDIEGGARLRKELELSVSDFGTARALLEALGYQVSMMYEKYRTTYELGDLEITLDEMPYGDFVEIEGPSGERIQEAAEQLGLDWEARILDSYTVLFERLRSVLGFGFQDLSFEHFIGIKVDPASLDVSVADKMN
jgi:adenylate cyclase class 2